MYKDRIVIPPSLRSRIVENLHSAHQGVSSMYSWAQRIVYWPRLVADLEEARSTFDEGIENINGHIEAGDYAEALPLVKYVRGNMTKIKETINIE